MSAADRLEQLLGKHYSPIICLSTIVGILFPDVFYPLTRFGIALFAALTFINSLDAGFRDLGASLRRPGAIGLMLGLIHVVIPLITLGTGRLLFPDDPLLVTGLLLQFAIPTGILSLMWVSLAGGNGPLTLSVVLLDTLLAPFLLPATLQLLVGSQVKMDAAAMMKDMLVMVAIPAVLAMTAHQLLGHERAAGAKRKLSLTSRFIVLTIASSNAAGIADEVRGLTPKLAAVTLVVLVLCAGSFWLGYQAARLARLDFPSAMSVSLNTGLRNISAGAVLAAQYFPAEVMFPVVISSLFMQLLASLAVRRLHATKQGKAWLAAKSP